MFGMGFMEILLIAIVAIIALGPEKLPGTMVQIAKFINKFKTGLEDAKATLDNELNISELKAEASKFKSQIEETKASLTVDSKIDLGLNDLMKDNLNNDSSIETKKVEEQPKQEKVSFKKEDKFKVKLDEKKEDNI
ncbi:twin-arginine translocase subunit TatB [Arcobacter suis]|uniref:Sec-independent protein translocase protein TatB homolog n=1 Tax=Arcobacter suis CECT 7833 TaxID=663365 RepID=A0AAD0SRP7_9BACT|nr:Sec-independent protein translocase protein TatB [Arcobacter suis]AXX89839.1 twin arginine translocation system, TatB protein [Arcobacter suis CECT 7833]RWS46441.1 twin-arginine translocase subunit TatB [Arcobacter suis]